MIKKILKQIGYAVLVLWGVVTLVFFLFTILPGDPAQMMVGQRSDAQTLKNIRAEYGFDQPVWKQYILYLNDLSPVGFMSESETGFIPSARRYPVSIQLIKFNNGWSVIVKPVYSRSSYQARQPVSKMIARALPNTLVLAFISIVVAAVLGILLGFFAALKQNSSFDKSIVSLSALGMSLPSFFAAILIGWLFAYVLGKYTGLNLTGNLFEIDPYGNGNQLVLKNLILPAITLAIRPLSVFVQLTRNSLLKEMSSEYFITSIAKGRSNFQSILHHAFKNALNPVVTTISGWFASMLAGVVFVEYVFGYKGLGNLMVEALNNYDFPIVMGCILTIAFIFLIINILVDIIYIWIDPRMRLQNH